MTTTDPLTEQIAAALDEAREDLCGFNARDMAAAVLPIVEAEVSKAKAEALREWATGTESQLDATATEGIDLGEWGRGLRSGIQQARETADQIEKEPTR